MTPPATDENEFTIVFSHVADAINNGDADFVVSVGEATPEEVTAIDELRRFAQDMSRGSLLFSTGT